MLNETGIIKVIQLDENGDRAARIDCADSLYPGPGRFILATLAGEVDSILGWPLFPVGLPGGMADFHAPLLGPLPATWSPGTQLHLRGPLGHGFHLPRDIRRLALAAFGDSPARLLPLISLAIESGADVAIFTRDPVLTNTALPPAVEIHPLSALSEVLPWANFLAMDLPLETLTELRRILNLDPYEGMPCNAEALVWTPMPCMSLAECGACAVPVRKAKYKLACKDGPVFSLSELDW